MYRLSRNSSLFPPEPITTAPSGEINNVSDALRFTGSMAHQSRAAAGHLERLGAQADRSAQWACKSASGIDTVVTDLMRSGVTGEAVTSLHTVVDQLGAAALRATEAHRTLTSASEQLATTAAAFHTAKQAFARQQSVAETYSANPDAGSKAFHQPDSANALAGSTAADYRCPQCGTEASNGHSDHVDGMAVEHRREILQDNSHRIRVAARDSCARAGDVAHELAHTKAAEYGYQITDTQLARFSNWLYERALAHGHSYNDSLGIARWRERSR